MQEVNILVSSAGRRNDLVGWFKEALHRNGVNGRIIVTDADRNAATRAAGDEFHLLPLISSPDYVPALLNVCAKYDIRLAMSFNDHELSLWAGLNRTPFEALGTEILALPEKTQRVLEDKLQMGALMAEFGISTPSTFSGTSIASGEIDPRSLGEEVVIKNRFGSGSSGLFFRSSAAAVDEVQVAARASRDRYGLAVSDDVESLDCVVVQTIISGFEYGLDIVNDMSSNLAAVLVRKKLRMRSGETDQAVSEPPDRFRAVGQSLSSAMRHRGVVDIDVIEDPTGHQWVIDINPRFGGGYPFSHLAGADIPAAYVAWLCGRRPEPSWLTYESGIISAKYSGIRRVGDLAQDVLFA